MDFLLPNFDRKNKLQLASTREGFGQALKYLGEQNENVVALTADLAESTKVNYFAEAFPDRFFDVGVAEQNLISVAAGLALGGKIPFAASYAVFSPGRTWDQIRVSVCNQKANVKIVGSHTGLTVGPDGATHQALEDIALMRVLPNMVVLTPVDAHEAYQATIAAAEYNGPVYLRLSRPDSPIFTNLEMPFSIGRARIVKEGTDVTLIACGPIAHEAIMAVQEAKKQNISVEIVINSTIKPLDESTILQSVKKTGAVVTVEEHQIAGGLGGAVAELLGEHYPAPLERIGVSDSFGQSGTPAELLKHYGLDAHAICQAILRVVKRKKQG